MVEWLKSLGSALWIGILGFLAYMAVVRASKHKATAAKLKIVAEDEKVVNENINAANEALFKARIADGKAKEAKKKAKIKIDKIGESHEEISTLLDRWKK